MLRPDPPDSFLFFSFIRREASESFGARPAILRFCVIHKKVGPTNCGFRNADCGMYRMLQAESLNRRGFDRRLFTKRS
jgi:hypothetical protein